MWQEDARIPFADALNNACRLVCWADDGELVTWTNLALQDALTGAGCPVTHSYLARLRQQRLDDPRLSLVWGLVQVCNMKLDEQSEYDVALTPDYFVLRTVHVRTNRSLEHRRDALIAALSGERRQPTTRRSRGSRP